MTATPTAPAWLADHDAALKPGHQADTYLVLIGGRPAYKLAVTPAKNRFSCAVTQTVNGRRVDAAGTGYATAGEAVAGGLEELRSALGW